MARAPKVGGRSPWGKIQVVEVILTGDIWVVSTAGHGGIKVSRSYQARIPKFIRREGGWYEEDIDWAIVAVTFPEAFKEKDVEGAHKTMVSWLPDEYRRLTGKEISAQESFVMRERKARAKHRDDWVVKGAWGDWHEAVPPGMVGVVATKGGRGGKERWFLVAENRYTIGPIGYVIDEALDVEIEPFA